MNNMRTYDLATRLWCAHAAGPIVRETCLPTLPPQHRGASHEREPIQGRAGACASRLTFHCPPLSLRKPLSSVSIFRAPCERGLAEAVSEARRLKWLEENREAIDYWNRDIAENGLPFDEYRQP